MRGESDVADDALPLWRTLLDKFVLPLLVLAVVAVATGLYAARSDLDRLEWTVARLQQDSAEHAAVFERFRAPGDRFTSADGARHDSRITKLEEQCQRCAESRIEVLARLKSIDDKQADVCSRMRLCESYAPRRGQP
jgi:hypothetical protein